MTYEEALYVLDNEIHIDVSCTTDFNRDYECLMKCREAIKNAIWRHADDEVPTEEGCVLGTVTGNINGVECIDAYMLVCYDERGGEWFSWEEPCITVQVNRWRPLTE